LDLLPQPQAEAGLKGGSHDSKTGDGQLER
jgi:hypothetical protein